MAESPCEKTVAIAAPITPHPNPKMQNKSKKTFKTVENNKNQNGVLLSHKARMILANKL